jgi:hypothetical protein
VYEVDNFENGELNTVIELLAVLVTGECNDIDEDGDEQSFFHCVSIIPHDFCQQTVQVNLCTKTTLKIEIPSKEELPSTIFYAQIENPPELING